MKNELQWPHDYEENKWRDLVERYEESWIQMTLALHTGERVHIVTYNEFEKTRVSSVLRDRGCNTSQIDIFAWRFEDVWARDNGPIFVFYKDDELHITDWGFNGWGERYDYENSDKIPTKIGRALNISVTEVPMINEGGSIEIDGEGTLMAKRSSILNENRNPGMTQAHAEAYFRKYLGVSNFIWLDGVKGMDITDDHIDGTARFADSETIITFYRNDFMEPSEYDILEKATNAKGEPYRIVHLPLTSDIVSDIDYGIYINYYIGNEVVLVPGFNDPNDDVAVNTLQEVYPDRRVVLIPMTEVYRDGGMVHCVTQQQPRRR